MMWSSIVFNFNFLRPLLLLQLLVAFSHTVTFLGGSGVKLVTGVAAATTQNNPTGTIHLFTSSHCEGSHMSCSNIPPNGCCSTGGDLFASTFLVSFQPRASVKVHSHPACKGFHRQSGALSCFQPSFAFSATQWSYPPKNNNRKRNSTEDSGDSDPENNNNNNNPDSEDEDEEYDVKDCFRPDTITLVDENIGEELKIQIPKGENTLFEHAFVKGEFGKLLGLVNIKRDSRVFR